MDALQGHHKGAPFLGVAGKTVSRGPVAPACSDAPSCQDEPVAEVSVFKLVATPGDPKLAAARYGVKRLRTVRRRRLAPVTWRLETPLVTLHPLSGRVLP